MTEPRPSIVILAGPNGAGKSTAAPELLQEELAVSEFVNADVIARGLSAFDPDRAAMAAGRVMLARLNELARQRESFAFETTLASRSFAPQLADLRASGYAVHLFLLWLSSADLAVQRVAHRVRSGGHDVPADTIRRRPWLRSMSYSTAERPGRTRDRLSLCQFHGDRTPSHDQRCVTIHCLQAEQGTVGARTKWSPYLQPTRCCS